ncbi:helix-turn-helix transcriptional regulator [Marinilabiliaceae bacterium ANBcel2]|nr:helix-turn-helix transcriptional regulator [Marinilabiliaceae bacterium ANBcel2]
MTKSLDNIKQIASQKPSKWIDDAKTRQTNRAWAKRSFQIAVRILREIRKQKPLNGMTQKRLAEEMGVSPQYINKVVKGEENLTLETIAKIEDVLGVTLIEILNGENTINVPVESQRSGGYINRNRSVPIANKVIDMELNYAKPTGTNG